mgnify:FL=1
MRKDMEVGSATVNSAMHESADTITSTSQAAGAVISALGELIDKFDY